MPTHFLQAVGIGLGRTGTRSLCEAFKMLGYTGVQHGPASAESLGFAEAAAEGACMRDWRQLYPSTQFILTVRSPRDWVESCKRALVEYPYERLEGGEWQSVMDANRRARYGWVAKSPDEEDIDIRLMTHFFLHNNNVLQQFADAGRQLLVMDIPAGDGWDKLCPFLGKSTPVAEFPLAKDF